MFKQVVKAVRAVAGFNEVTHKYATPSLTLKLGHSLKKCCQIVQSSALQNQLLYECQQAREFHELLDSDWAGEVSSRALCTLSDNRIDKEQQTSLSEDIAKLHKHIDDEISRCVSALQAKVTVPSWLLL